MAISTTKAKTTYKNIAKELYSLDPSTIIDLFTLDISDILFEQKLQNRNLASIFRFHGVTKLPSSTIIFNSKKYVPLPIQLEGWEVSSKGQIPRPTLTMSVHDPGVSALADLRQRIKELDNLSGAKVTRLKTFAKFIDLVNFPDSDNKPKGFSPDSNARILLDEWVINRKNNESKNVIEFELISKIDAESRKLPNRIINKDICVWNYRGGGCLYESDSNRNSSVHDSDAIMPDQAPPKANINNERIYGEVIKDSSVSPVSRGQYQLEQEYKIGEYVYIEKDSIKYYFVAKKKVPKEKAPPNDEFWEADECARNVKACGFRWGEIGDGRLPMAAFPGIKDRRAR